LRGRTGSHRVLRGGSFNNNERNVRCARRNRNNPNNRNRNNGFRVVLAHNFLSLPEMPGGDRFLAEAAPYGAMKAGAVRPWPRLEPSPPSPLPNLGEGRGKRVGAGRIGQARPLPGVQVRAGAGNGHSKGKTSEVSETSKVWCFAK